MTIDEKAHHVAQMLMLDQKTPRVVAFDPATIVMLVSILKQLAGLLRWWKPEWFVNWQMDRVIRSHVAEAKSGASVKAIRRAILKSNELVPLGEISLF